MPDKEKKILIVDDESPIRRVLHQKLAKEGYQCEEADSAEQAMNWLADNTADVVILDIETPGRSGIEVRKNKSQLSRHLGDSDGRCQRGQSSHSVHDAGC